MLPEGVRLFHVRHGETDWNVEGRLQGQLDISMNDRGREQAARNGAALRERLAGDGIAPDALDCVSSPLGRAVETMRIVRAELGLAGAFRTDARLREVSFGDWSGFTYDELKASGERARVLARRRDKWGFRPPGGETYGDLAARVCAFLKTVRSDTLVVSHGGVFRVLHGLLLGTPWHEVPGLPAPQDRFAIFADGRVEIV